VPKATIVNWLTGRVARPRRWQDLVRVADAMRLGHGEVDELLAAASQPSLVELARVIDDDGRVLLEPWVSSASSGLPVAAQLPLVATPFLGRTSERGAVISLVCDPDVRVVTLTGSRAPARRGWRSRSRALFVGTLSNPSLEHRD